VGGTCRVRQTRVERTLPCLSLEGRTNPRRGAEAFGPRPASRWALERASEPVGAAKELSGSLARRTGTSPRSRFGGERGTAANQ